jgi:hypothetical protein
MDPGGMTATILLDGFVDRTGSMRALVARRRIRMNPPRLGNTTTALTIPIAEANDAPDSLRTLLAEVGYRGAFNVESSSMIVTAGTRSSRSTRARPGSSRRSRGRAWTCRG